MFRYINGTHDFGVLYNRSDSTDILGFSDADWAGWEATRKSTSGAIFPIAGGAVSWKSKKQSCVATSTCEAEYSPTKEAIWLSRLVSDTTNSRTPQVIKIRVDNNGTIDTAKQR